MRRVWVIGPDESVTEQVRGAALAAGATEVVQGGRWTAVSPGYHEEPDPPPDIFGVNAAFLNARLDERITTLGGVIGYPDVPAAPAILATIAAAPDLPNVAAGTLTAAVLSDTVRALKGYVQDHRIALRAMASTLLAVRTIAQENRDGIQIVALVDRDLLKLIRGDFADIDEDT